MIGWRTGWQVQLECNLESSQHLVIVQFGDYGDAVRRFAQGGGETYYAQRYSVDYVASLVSRFKRVTVVTVLTDQLEALLPNGVYVRGVQLFGSKRSGDFKRLIGEVEALKPDRLVVMTPLYPVLRWADRSGLDTLPLFFDSFRASGIRARIGYWKLGRLLASPRFRWVANHGTAAAADLVRIGVPAEKVLPIDWPAFDSPIGRNEKTLRTDNVFEVIFVGQISIAKGALELILAIDNLNRTSSGKQYRVSFVGKESGDNLEARARQSAFPDRIRFVGAVAHEEIVDLMAKHDAVVVPSRHDYPEGMPMTIYESFCSRSPLIASDHPMFEQRLRDRYNCLRFKAASDSSLSEALRVLSEDAELYSMLSRNTLEAASRHFHPLKYHEVLDYWLSRSAEADAHLARQSVAALRT